MHPLPLKQIHKQSFHYNTTSSNHTLNPLYYQCVRIYVYMYIVTGRLKPKRGKNTYVQVITILSLMADLDDQIVQINKNDCVQAKNALDDEISTYFGNNLFKEVHTHTDIKLLLGYLSCAIAGGAFLYEYKTSFQEAQSVTLVCVITFWVLQLGISAYSSTVEKGVVFVGKNEKGTIQVKSTMEPYSPIYKLELVYKESNPPKKVTYTLSKSISSWITTKGIVDQVRFHEDLQHSLDKALSSFHRE
ncbi:microsomal signal peptidase 25 kDa subunit-domain-containing protein [Phycomyces nitens]|nr:microsomal signal peptidase 25 kDa subunit-domain-containing protein [Phycomyces nitens]